MGGDYTRFTFEPRRDHAGVLMQQGRVQLDADWNEWVEMIDRRLLAETLDLAGRRCGVPRTTPDGFRIERDPDGRLTIGRGRIYVDGILVENHGSGDPEIEPVWREVRGQDPIQYRDQPYRRPSSPATEPGGTGRHLVYLDVWRREVTAVEEPEMVERALGVDTTTRFQTAWAVRCIPNVPAHTRCATNLSRIEEWVTETRPSGARLTTGTPDVPEEPDPCLIQPTGGYRGIENRLYRVEIHDDGTEAGRPISFKWSRDNGSVAATIGSIADATTKPRLTVNRLGRDAILRFHDLEWVELTDDQREAEGRPGIMARVERADDATATITLVAPLGELPDMARNPRVRRWDQTADQVNARGVIPIEPLPTEVELEDGVRVRFTLDGADPPHVGDYWVFAARAADGSVEQLDEALPRGVRHHYCPLAVLRGDEIEDCRDIFPEECDDCECTVCVSPESHADRTLTIQDAVDQVRERGGKICLAPGIYEVRRPVRIRGARGIQLAGKGSRSVIVHQGAGPAIDIEECYDVTIERVAIASASSGLGALLIDREAERTGARRRRTRRRRKVPRAPEIGILITKAVGTTIERCVLAQSESLVKGPRPIAEEVRATDTRGTEYTYRDPDADYIIRERSVGSIGVAFAGIAVETRIRDNVVFAETGVGLLALGRTPAPPKPTRDPAGSEWSRSTDEASSLYRVDERRMRTTETGDSRMVEYAIRSDGSGGAAMRRAEAETAETASMLRETASVTMLPRYLVTLRLLIEDNVFVGARAGVDLTTFGGLARTTALVIHAGETRVAGNSIYRARVGIALMGLVPGAGLTSKALGTTSRGPDTRVTMGFAGVAGAAGSHVEVARNTCALGSIGILLGCDGARVVGNDLSGTGAYPTSGITLVPAFYGSYSTGYAARKAAYTAYYRTLLGLEVRGNRVSGFAEFGIDSPRYGPALIGAEIAENRVEDCGIGGIQVTLGYAVTIAENEVRNVGEEATDYAAGIALIRGSDASRISGNIVADVGHGAQGLSSCIGIGVGRATNLRVAQNHLSSIAGELLGIPISAIEINQGADRTDIVDNTVLGPDEGDTGADWAAVRIESGEPIDADEVTLLIRGNQLEAAGTTACVALASAPGRASLTLADNRCVLATGSEGVPAAVVELGGWYQMILGSNHVQGTREVLGIIGDSELYTVLGNIVTTGIQISGSPLGTPWDALNISH